MKTPTRLLLATLVAALLLPTALPAAPLLDSATTGAQIVGGTEATEEYPWMVSLQTRSGSHFCGASLVREDWVLTASHCVDGDGPEQLQVMLGSHHRSQPGDVHDVAEIIMHPRYDDVTIEYDVALLRLETPATQEPVPLVTLDQRDLWAPGTTSRVIGWGTTFFGSPTIPDELREVDVPVVADDDCADSYNNPVFTTLDGDWFMPETMVCAGEFTGGKDACQGDSGGPLMVRDEDGQWTQMGVVSWGIGCAFPVFYGVYARTGEAPLQTWIEEHLPELEDEDVETAA